ncbi:hypothetical protein MKX07_003879 [Trichoderma sp. CBMAI-0711]|nr:hypothetical protein MKX07_003879 [Trichoderma sp. CBMAI-0711]
MPNYVPITPKPAQDFHDAASASSEAVENNKRRRVSVTVACNACRRKKTRCDGKRPVCSACKIAQIDCTYRDDSGLSEESQSLLQEIFRTLNALPGDQVLERPNAAIEMNMMSDAF